MVATRSATSVARATCPIVAVDTASIGLPTPAPTPLKSRSKPYDRPSTPTTPTPSKKSRAPGPDKDLLSPIPLQLSANAGTAVEEDLLPPTLSFDLAVAKSHLIAADPRFEEVFANLPCKPFEVLDVVHPFRTLVTSILGQQISWRAARSIVGKFLRLFDSTLPERWDQFPPLVDRPFPKPHQLASTDIPTLRSAGLSGRKAEYVLDLASNFADGRLSPSKLASADDERMAEMLIAVRGIGRWTVDMFALFSARRPDIMPYGDLGTQKGLLRWILASHEPTYRISVEAKKIPEPSIEAPPDSDVVAAVEPAPEEPDASAIPPAPVPPATPERVHTLPTPPPSPAGVPLSPSSIPVKLPDGLTVDELKARLAGKRKPKKGMYLTPAEMDALTESWKPYRSIAVWYMWAVEEIC